MTKSELLYMNHTKELYKKAMTTGNWTLLVCVLQHADILPSPTIQQMFYELADLIAATIYENMSFINLLRKSGQISLGCLVGLLDNIPKNVYGLGQLSRNKIDDIAKTVNASPIAIRLQENLISLGINVISIVPTNPAAYISKSIKPVKEIYELYQWASVQSPKYYDTALDTDYLFSVLNTTNVNEISSVLDSILDNETAVNNACE